jgi:hypothetical protein
MSSTDRASRNPLHRLIDWLVRLESAFGPVHSAGTAADRERTLQRWDAELDEFWTTVPKLVSEATDALACAAIAWCARHDQKDVETRNLIERGSRLVVDMAQCRRPLTCEWNDRDPETTENRALQKKWSEQRQLLDDAHNTARLLRRIAANAGEEWRAESASASSLAGGPGGASEMALSIDDLFARIEKERPNPIALSATELALLVAWLRNHALPAQTSIDASRGDAAAIKEQKWRMHLAFARCCAEKKAAPLSLTDLFDRIQSARPDPIHLIDNERVVLACWLKCFPVSFSTRQKANAEKIPAAIEECARQQHLKLVLGFAEQLHAKNGVEKSTFEEQVKAEEAERQERREKDAERKAIRVALLQFRLGIQGDQRSVADLVAGYMGIGDVLRENSLDEALDELTARTKESGVWTSSWTEHIRLLRISTDGGDGAEDTIRQALTSHLESREAAHGEGTAGRFFRILRDGTVGDKLAEAVEAVFGRPTRSDSANAAPSACENDDANKAAVPTKAQRTSPKGDVRDLLIAELTRHHKYADGSCLNLEPIGNNKLADAAGVARSTASKFFADEFKGYSAYRVKCRDAGKLSDSLKLLNGEFSPHDLYGRTPPGEKSRDEADE